MEKPQIDLDTIVMESRHRGEDRHASNTESWFTACLIAARRAFYERHGADNEDLELGSSEAQVEDLPAGYPRYSALIASDAVFYICRSFSALRARLLLLKQDKLVLLENRLNQIDEQEQAVLFLGMSRADANSERRDVLNQIDVALVDYDNLIERTSRVLKLRQPRQRDITSLSNWLDGTAALARDETTYLDRPRELISLGSAEDNLAHIIEGKVEDALVRFYSRLRKLPGYRRSRDRHVYLYSGTLIKRLSQLTISALLAFLLLSPIVACFAIQSMAVRLFIIVIANMTLLAVMASLSYQRTFELFVAGTTYSAVLVVFLSGSNNVSN